LLHEGTNVLKVDLVKIRVPVQLEHVRTRVSGEMGEETKFRLNLAANCCVCFVDSGCWGGNRDQIWVGARICARWGIQGPT